jgi:DNA mismatch repair protein MutL
MAHLSHAIRTKLKNAISKKTINFVNDDSQVLNNSLSINNTFAAQMEQTSSTTHSTKSQQVQAPKQPYQLSENMPTSQTVNTSVISENINQNTSDISNDVAINSTSLPYCLDVIDDLNNVLTEFASTTYIEDKALPLLLFYYQSQHLLISAADWQAKLSSLFESRVFRDTVLKNEKMLNSAAAINQQLATVSMQMSPQDLMIFIADMESVLVKHAIKSIDSHRLVALMLSSAPE